jgi:hypothetical protein
MWGLDRAANSEGESSIGIRHIDFCQQRPGAKLQGIGDPLHLAGKGAVRNFRHAHHGVGKRVFLSAA